LISCTPPPEPKTGVVPEDQVNWWVAYVTHEDGSFNEVLLIDFIYENRTEVWWHNAFGPTRVRTDFTKGNKEFQIYPLFEDAVPVKLDYDIMELKLKILEQLARIRNE